MGAPWNALAAALFAYVPRTERPRAGYLGCERIDTKKGDLTLH